MTLEQIIDFVSRNEGKWLPTIGGRARFTVHKVGERAFRFTTQAGTPRNENYDYIGRSLKVFNETGSFKIQDYQLTSRTVNASYVLGLFWQTASEIGGLQNVPPETPIEDKEVLAAKPTEQTALRKSRLGQGPYRESLLRLRRCCYVTGFSEARLLRASHIKPWVESNNRERLDPCNGLLLIPNYDLLFDKGLISFEDDGRILISSQLSGSAITALGINTGFNGSDLGDATKVYLAYHRQETFRP